MKRFISSTCILLLLSLYLIVPFKIQFLNILHTLSHVSMHQDPHHHHNHYFNDHDHHHGLLARISISIDDQESTQPIPENISEYRFEPPYPPHFIRMINAQPKIITKKFYQQMIPVLTGAFFEVPTPPP